jgi:hypothetical protein
LPYACTVSDATFFSILCFPLRHFCSFTAAAGDVTLPVPLTLHQVLTVDAAGRLYIASDRHAAGPAIGDLRIGFSVAPGDVPVTVLGAISLRAGTASVDAGGSSGPIYELGQWRPPTADPGAGGTTSASADEQFISVFHGDYTAAQAYTSLHNSNWWWTWALRFVGWLALFVAFTMLFDPLHAVAELIPFFGPFISSVLGLGTGAVSLALATAVTAVGVAAGWLAARSLLLTLVVGVVVAHFAYACLGAKPSQAQAQAQSPPEPQAQAQRR